MMTIEIYADTNDSSFITNALEIESNDVNEIIAYVDKIIGKNNWNHFRIANPSDNGMTEFE